MFYYWGGANIEQKFNTWRRIAERRNKRKKNGAFLNNRWAMKKNVANIAVDFVSVKNTERR